MADTSILGFDADDTLWQNLSFYRADRRPLSGAACQTTRSRSGLGDALLETERRNLKRYGFGIKGFTLSMIETAIEVTRGQGARPA